LISYVFFCIGRQKNIRAQASDGRNLSDHDKFYHNDGHTSSWVPPMEEDDIVLQILATTVITAKGSWTKNGQEVFCSNCPMLGSNSVSFAESHMESSKSKSSDLVLEDSSDILDCGRAANFTYYDQLIGIANRQNHPHVPEPQVAMVFKKKGSKKDTIDLNTLERKLRKAKKEVNRLTKTNNIIVHHVIYY